MITFFFADFLEFQKQLTEGEPRALKTIDLEGITEDQDYYTPFLINESCLDYCTKKIKAALSESIKTHKEQFESNKFILENALETEGSSISHLTIEPNPIIERINQPFEREQARFDPIEARELERYLFILILAIESQCTWLSNHINLIDEMRNEGKTCSEENLTDPMEKASYLLARGYQKCLSFLLLSVRNFLYMSNSD